MSLTDDDVREILRIIDESDLSELRIDTDGFSLHVVKGGADAPAVGPPVGRRHVPEPGSDRARGRAETEAPPQAEEANGSVTVPAPMLGTFYRAEAPGKPPFVEVGSRVEPDTTVCIIEVMKMMNSVHAGVAGTIREVCAENGAMVEYGAPLFRIEP